MYYYTIIYKIQIKLNTYYDDIFNGMPIFGNTHQQFVVSPFNVERQGLYIFL